MKKTLTVLLVVVLLFGALPSAMAQGEPETSMEEMLPVLDSVMRAMVDCNCAYSPDSSAYFWTVLGLLAVNWQSNDPLCEIVDEQLRVPKKLMQEYAAAAFLTYDDLLPLDGVDGWIAYDADWDAYTVGLGDVGDSYTRIKAVHANGDGTFGVDVAMEDGEGRELYVMTSTLAPNPYADAVSDGTFPYSVSEGILTEVGPEVRTRTVSMEGEPEDITETRYENPYGYSLWYGDAFIIKQDDTDASMVEFVPVDPDALAPVSLTIARNEVEDGEALFEEALADHRAAGFEVGEIETGTLESGLAYRQCECVSEGVVSRFTLVEGDMGSYCVTATFPVEAAEGYGVRLDMAVKTIEE